MKKIRFLAIFLVLLMLAMPVLTACDKGGSGDGGSSSEEDPTSSSSSRKPRPSGGPGNTPPTKDGYIVYEDFNTKALGAFGTAGYVASAAKNGVTYSVVESDNFAEGEEQARALYFYRTALEDTSNRDGFINVTPSEIDLADVYALEFSLMVTEKTTVNIAINGRKAPGGSAVFNEFVRYEAGTKKLMANTQTITEVEMNKWYTVTIMIDDQNKTYDVYVDGWKKLGQVDYKTSNYPNRTECPINLYRITMSGGTSENEFYLDNVAVYKPEDGTNLPKNYQGNEATTYEQIFLPDITLFDANNISYDILAAIMGETKTNMNGLDGVTGKTDLKDGFRYEAVSIDGSHHYPLADNWGDEFKAVEEGYTSYLFLDGYNSGFNNASFLFDPEFMASAGIPVQTGKEVKEKEEIFTGDDNALFYDISNYSTLTIEFFIPQETRNQDSFYQFMLYLASGNRWPAGEPKAGISYYNAAYKTNDTKFAAGFYTMTISIGSLGGTRTPSLTTITGIEFKFNGWNNTVNGAATSGNPKPVQNVDFFLSDDHPIAIKTIKLSGGVKVPVEDAAPGMENCTHANEDGSTAMTEQVVIVPTCTDFGYTANKCTLCGKTTPVQGDASLLVSPTGHRYGSADENAPDYNERDIIYPTCTAGGSATAKCLDCGFEAVQEKYNPLGHAYITKIDTVNEQISNNCPICGDFQSTKFAEKLPAYSEIMDAITNAGHKFEAGFVASDDAKASDSFDNTTSFDGTDTGNKPTFGTKFNILCRGARFDVMTEGEGEDAFNFIRFYAESAAHSYAELNGCRSANSQDLVFEFSVRLGPQVDGKYASYGDFNLIDRSTAALAAGGNLNFTFASINDEGKLITKNTDFTVQFSETAFTNISYVFHFSNNTMDIYVDGLLKARGVTINASEGVNMAAYCPDEIRMLQVQKAQTLVGTWIDIASCVAYTASFPVTFTGVDIDGVVNDYSGDILNETEIAVNGTSVDLTVDPLKKNSTYVIEIDYKAGATAMTNGVLFTGVKGNYYGEVLTEAILTVNEYGDILFYNQIIGSTSEDAMITIAVNEDNNILTVYVNGEYIASGWYNNADYYNADDQVYLSGFVFGAVEGADYTVATFYVYTGLYTTDAE